MKNLFRLLIALLAIKAAAQTTVVIDTNNPPIWPVGSTNIPISVDSNGRMVSTGGTGGGGTPGGSDTQVQFNNAGAFGGASAITYNSGTLTTTFSGPVTFDNGLISYGYPPMSSSVISATKETEIRTLTASEQESFSATLPDKSVKRVRYIASGGNWTVTYNTTVNAFGYGDISATGFVVPNGTAVEIAYYGTGSAPYAAAVPLPVNLANGVFGVLPIANGGTNASSFGTTGGVTYYDGTRLVNSSLMLVDTTTLALTHQYNALTTTTTAAETLINTTAATNAVQVQNSPALVWSAQGWASSPVASRQVDFALWAVPVTGTANPTGLLTLASQINAGGWSTGSSNFTFSSGGGFTAGSITTQNTLGTTGITVQNNQFFGWSSQSRIKSSTNGQITLFNNAESGFSRLSFGGNTTSFTGIATSGTTMTFGFGDGTAGGAFVFSGTLKIGSSGTALTQVRRGTATLVAGTVVVSDAAVTANSEIYVGTKTVGGTAGATFISSKTAATGFTISSTNVADTSVVSYLIIEP